jgi:DNA recombination-dependent growth factor C
MLAVGLSACIQKEERWTDWLNQDSAQMVYNENDTSNMLGKLDLGSIVRHGDVVKFNSAYKPKTYAWRDYELLFGKNETNYVIIEIDCRTKFIHIKAESDKHGNTISTKALLGNTWYPITESTYELKYYEYACKK